MLREYLEDIRSITFRFGDEVTHYTTKPQALVFVAEEYAWKVYERA